jgi:hypothetical protein
MAITYPCEIKYGAHRNSHAILAFVLLMPRWAYLPLWPFKGTIIQGSCLSNHSHFSSMNLVAMKAWTFSLQVSHIFHYVNWTAMTKGVQDGMDWNQMSRDLGKSNRLNDISATLFWVACNLLLSLLVVHWRHLSSWIIDQSQTLTPLFHSNKNNC